MKKSLLIISMTTMFFLGSVNLAVSQEQPKPKKDTVNIDSDAKPTFYYAVEDEATSKSSAGKGNTLIIAVIAGVAVVVAGGFLLMKKKKK